MKTTNILVIILFAGIAALSGCKELNEILDDFYEEAPGYCKDQCAAEYECEQDDWEDYTNGDYADDAYSDAERMCVFNCAYPISEGVYIVEYDSSDDEYDFKGKISGKTWEKYDKCMWDSLQTYYDCDDDVWGIPYDDIDEDYCEAVSHCYDLLDLGWSCDWEEESGYEWCECDTNEESFYW